MYHVHFRGSHYEIGYRFGCSLKNHGQQLLNKVPFPITQERMDFAAACLPLYQAFFPEILEEIRGLAEGQQCEPGLLQAVLFSMYAIPPACGCSCFAIADGEHILLGRNSDFLTALEKLNTNAIYQLSGCSHTFTGNTTAFVEMEDGVNEHGLAVGLTAVSPLAAKPGLVAGMLLRFLLEKCSSTKEALCHLRRLPIGSAQTITVADSSGDVAVVECSPEHLCIIQPTRERPFVCATNCFTAPDMLPMQKPEVDNWQSAQRQETLVQTLGSCGGSLDIPAAQNLLAGKNGFLCQYDRSTGKDTVWSVLYDLKNRAIYRAEGNPGRKKFVADTRFFK